MNYQKITFVFMYLNQELLYTHKAPNGQINRKSIITIQIRCNLKKSEMYYFPS